MTDRRDDPTNLSADDQRLVREIAEHYAPPEATPASERAFDVRLRERLETPQRTPIWKPALATALGVAALGWLLAVDPPERPAAEDLVTTVEPAPLADPIDALVEFAEREGDEADLLFTALGETELEEQPSEDFLPADYAAISGIFLGS